MKYKLGIVLSFAFILAFSQISFAQNETPAEWTLMFYMDADNNLEEPQMIDLEEIMAVGSSQNINLIVLSDRSEIGENTDRQYTNRAVGGLKNWTTAKYSVIEKGRLREIADWGEVNMGDPATLRKFLQTASKQFPAKRFGLVFGNHGAGWEGIVGDESANSDSLTMNELPPVLKDFTASSGKLEMIGFDACLMANFEAARTFAPFAKTMVASEELEPGDGWNYTPLMSAFSKNPQMDGVALGKTVVNTYRDYYLTRNSENYEPSVTLGVLDLQAIPALETALNDFGLRNLSFIKTGGRTNWLKTSNARSKTAEFGKADDGGDGSYFYDIIDYAENIKREQPDAATVKAADAVIAATKSVVLYKINGAAHPRSNGLSIYFPSKKNVLLQSDYKSTPFSVTGKWFPFLADYTGVQAADTQAPTIEDVETSDNDVAENDVITVTAKVNADDLEEATFVLAESHDDQQIIIGALPAEPDDDGVLKEEWDGEWFSIGDGKKELICPITDFQEIEDAQDTFYVEVPAQIRFKGTNKWRDVTLYFYLDFNEEEVVGEFVNAFSFKGNQAREVEIEAGDSIRPVYVSIDNDGETSLVTATDEADILNVTKDNEITVGRTDVAPGKYLIGFTATDYAGNTSEDFTEVTIE